MSGAEGAAAASAAAAARQRREQEEEEEEEMALPEHDPSGQFEYKIIRSATGTFKKPERFQQMLEEQSRAGWELLEKLDDCRVRLKRSVTCRQKDQQLGQDPYLTHFGIGEGLLGVWVLLGVLISVALVIGILIMTVGR